MSNDNPFRAPDEEDFRTVPRKRHRGLEYAEAREVWPACEECGKRVDVICPFCKTVDNLFPLGDSTYWVEDLGDSLVDYQKNVDRELSARSVLFGEADTSIPESGGQGGCHCGSGGCGSEDEPEESWFTVDDPPLVLICPTCADVFVPDFPSKCRKCRGPVDEEYHSQLDQEDETSDLPVAYEEPQGSAWFLMAGLLVFFLIVVTVIYFVF